MIPPGNGKLDQSGPSWTGLIAVLAIGIGIWQVIDPRVNFSELKTEIKGQQAKLDDKIDRNEKATLETLRKEDVTQAEYREFKVREDARLGSLETQLLKLEDGQVTRNEHIQHWRDTDTAIDSLRNQLTELRNKYDAAYNAGDALKSLQKQIDDLRGVHVNSVGVPPTAVPGHTP